MGLLNKGVKLFLKTAIGINVLTAVITLLSARTLLGLFTPDAAVIDAGFTYLTYLLPFYWIYSIIHILSSVMNGVGEVKVPTYIRLLMFWGIRVPLAWYLSTYFSGKRIARRLSGKLGGGMRVDGDLFPDRPLEAGNCHEG